ncbi:hypothetical protein [Nonomuraea sp. B1E8]
MTAGHAASASAFPLMPERRLVAGIVAARGLTRAVTEVPGADVAA